jgi:phage gpG-like protein
MPDKIIIDINSNVLRWKIDTLQERSNDTSPAFARIVQVMASSVEKNFEVEGRYSDPGSWYGGSTKWEQHSLATPMFPAGTGMNRYSIFSKGEMVPFAATSFHLDTPSLPC